MYNVLACDDEQIAIDSIKFIFEKNFQSQVNLFTALSGFEALNIVKQNDIDIIFMDINMPGMTGLETISLITQMKPNIVIIVLSAFDTFQYAQEALNLGAFRYITKPVNRNTIIQTARSAMNQVDATKGSGLNSEEIRKKLETVSPMVESDFFFSCAFCTENEDLTPYLEYFNLLNKHYVFTALEFTEQTPLSRRDMFTQIRQIVAENQECIMGSFMSNRAMLLIAFENEGFFPEKVRETLKKIHTLFTMKISRNIRTGVSSVCTKEIQFKDHYNQAVTALNNSSEGNSLVFFEDIVSPVNNIDNSKNILERIFKRLKNGDIEGVQFLSGLYLQSLEEAGVSSDTWKFSLIELLVNTKSTVQSICQNFDTSLFDSAFAVISKAESISETSSFIQQRLSEAVNAVSLNNKAADNPIISKVKTYINLHLSENFSLEDVAESVGVSHFYLSKLFREETSETFINYLTEQRLDKAKQLLQETDLSVKEITASCGYNDQNYFSKLFKNRFGVSPTDFRQNTAQRQ